MQIPHDQLKRYIEYRAEREGIRVILQEESYTSKASYLQKDVMPVYGKEEGNPVFSGRREGRLYKTETGLQINADLNGAANIVRKNMPAAFEAYEPDFRRIRVIRHPDRSEEQHAIPDRG